MEEVKKNNKKNILIIIVLCFLVIGLGGYIVYDKILSNGDITKEVDKKNEGENKFNSEKNIIYKSYNIGDKVIVKLNDSTESTFYVLKESSEKDEYITLFAEKNIGTSAFQEDFNDGNEFEGSLIQSKLNELTNDWTNVKEKRLITVDEIKATGLTYTQMEARCVDVKCPEEEYTYVKKDNFLRYPSGSIYEFYWTMTKVVSENPSTGNTNHYAYYVDMSGCIEQHIVGYKPGSKENPTGMIFSNFGIRPVIIISKDFIV